MVELIAPGLYVISGVLAYAAVHHLGLGLASLRNPRHLILAAMCLLVALGAIFHAQMIHAASVADYVLALRKNLHAYIVAVALLPWFVASYTGIRVLPFLTAHSVLFAALLVANQTLPDGLQYDQIAGIYRLHLPWGEIVARARGRAGLWTDVGALGFCGAIGYAIWALNASYRRTRSRAALWMLAGTGLFAIAAAEGLLVRLSALDFVEAGPFGFAATIMILGAALARETNEKLRVSESKYHSLFANSPQAMLALDPHDGAIVEANETALRMLGYSKEELLTKTFADITRPQDLQDARERLQQLSAGAVSTLRFDRWYVRKDGASALVDCSVCALKDDQGKVARLIASASDITERRRTEDALLESQEKLRGFFEQSSLGIALTDMQGHYLEFNEAFAQICGYPPEELKQLDYWTLTPKKYEADERQQLEMLERNGRYGPYEKEYVRKDGSLVPLRLSGLLIRGGDGERYIWSIVEDVTEANRAKAALKRESQKNLALLRNASDGIHILDGAGNLLEASDSFCEMLGYRREEIIGQNVAQWDAQLQGEDLLEKLRQQLLRPVRSQFESVHRRKDGSLLDVEISGYPLEIDGMALLFNSSRDITERKQSEAALRESEARFRTIIEQSPVAISCSRDGITVDVNSVYLKMFGYDHADQVRGQPVLNRIAPQCRGEMEDRIRKRQMGIATDSNYETVGLRRDGSQFPVFVSAKRIETMDGPMYFAFLIDFSERKAAEEKIKHLAFYDHLTDLANRQLLNDRVHRALASSSRSSRHSAVLLIDLDNFKTVNDTLGHLSGDTLLREIAKRLTTIIREGDSVARLGGDEFVVLLEGLHERQSEAVAQAEAVGEKILQVLGAPYQLGNKSVRCTCSIGVTLFRDPRLTPEDVIKQADIAMYEAKDAGRDVLRFFDPRMQELINARVTLESDLHKALESRQFVLHFQIQVDSSYLPIGAEALIRWVHPERGVVSPAQFIPLAEQTGLIVPIGQWVLEAACAQLQTWRQNALTRDLVLSINVSSQQFRKPNFVDQVQIAIQRHGINPAQLKLELTESMLADNIEETIATMNALKAIGVKFSLDDFGTGYSCLQYLKRLPLDQLKIDQSFVRDIAADPNDNAIVRTVVAMAHSLNVDVIAEGVETEEQRDLLVKCGCLHFQGYLFGRPVAADDLASLVEANFVGLSKDRRKASAERTRR